MDNAQTSRKKGNLLVVDDDLLFRQTLEALLSGEGYEVRCAPSGGMALMFAAEEPPELILLDIRLPDMDGFEVCRRLREDPRTGRIPVIFISGLDDVVGKVRGFAAGGVDYITKPYQGEEVLARVGSHLDLKRAKEVLQRTNEELEARVKTRTADLSRTNEQLAASEASLEERLRFEKLLAEISAGFVNLPADQVDGEIEGTQRRMCEFLDLDRSALWQVPDLDPGALLLTHAYQVQGAPPIPKRPYARDLFPWSAQKVLAGETVTIKKMSDLPPEASRDRESYTLYGTKSTLLCPLSVGGGPPFGLLTFAVMREERDWPETVGRGLRLIAQLFANALARKQMEEQLHARLREIEGLRQRLEEENIYLREEAKLSYTHEEIIGQSEAIRKVLADIEKVARTDSTVLITGETGTGKDLIARAIHNLSNRKGRLMVTVNCASLPPTLIESELFGREKGAYTGALTRQMGRFEIANGSTLFLDEIGELPLELQAKFLKVLQDGEFERVGSVATIKVDVRIIAATNRNLAEEIRRGKFRQDLFYRMSVFPIKAPPLREHPEDIPLLVNSLVEEFGKRMGKKIHSISRKTMEDLQRYSWPGNVRELRNLIEQAFIISSGDTLRIQVPRETVNAPSKTLTADEMERQHIMKVLEMTKGRIKGSHGAAEILGLKPSTLYSRMVKFGIASPHKKDDI